MVLLKKIFGYTLAVVTIGFVLLVIGRMVHFSNLEKTTAVVEKIHSTKLTLADVMGDNLPPDPGEAKDATIAGIDANQNGIRDDVELAVFKQYPKSAKIRAALLQYALVLQMEFTQPVVNKTTATEVIRELSRADSCLSDTLVPRKSPESFRSSADIIKIENYISYVRKIQINTIERKAAEEAFYQNLGSYSDLDPMCDIDISTLPK